MDSHFGSRAILAQVHERLKLVFASFLVASLGRAPRHGRMVALGRPDLLAWLIGGLLRLTFASSLPPSCRQSVAHAPSDLRRWSAGVLHARVRSPQLCMGLITRGPAVRGFDQQGGRAVRGPRVAVACAPCGPGAGAPHSAHGGSCGAFALLGDLLQAAPRAATQTPAPATTQRPLRPRMRRSRDSANVSHH